MKLIEKAGNERYTYDVVKNEEVCELRYSDGFANGVQGRLAISFKDTGNGVEIAVYDGNVSDNVERTVNFDYSQKAMLLGILLLNDDSKYFTSEEEKLN